MLFKWNIETNDICDDCGKCDTVTHFLYSCCTVKCFWEQIMKWIKYNLDVNIPLSLTDIIFGIPHKDNLLLIINYIILYGKWYIYRTKLHKDNLFLLSFLTELKSNIEMERLILISKGRETEFEKFNLLYMSL